MIKDTSGVDQPRVFYLYTVVVSKNDPKPCFQFYLQEIYPFTDMCTHSI